MYYRIAVQAWSSPTWRWVSRPRGSMNVVKRWLLYYHATPRGRLRVFQSTSSGELREQIERENNGLPSQSVQAVDFVAVQH